MAAPVSEDSPTSCTGLPLGPGEVAGEPLDDGGQHDADEHRDDRDDLRVAAPWSAIDRGVGRPLT